MQTFLDTTLGFAIDAQRVTCPGGGGGGGGGGRRRLLQQEPVRLSANVAGPGAGNIINEAVQPGSPVYAELSQVLRGLDSADVTVTDPPPSPPAADDSALPRRRCCVSCAGNVLSMWA